MPSIQTRQNTRDYCLQNCYDIVKANRNELTPEEEAPAEAAEEVSTDAAQEEFDVIGGSDNKPEQL